MIKPDFNKKLETGRCTSRDEYGNADINGIDMTFMLGLDYESMATLATALNRLADYEDLFKESRWIPVSERLPKEDEYVDDVCKYYLIQDEYGDMHIACYKRTGWIPLELLCAIGCEVVAWMELPEPYGGEDHD